MPEIIEGEWKFIFPESWSASKFDDWKFYREKFQGLANFTKAIDILAFNPDDKTAWLIEIKDFRSAPRSPEKEKNLPLDEEIALKIVNSLAGIFAARFQANIEEEQNQALNILKKSKNLKVAFHLIQPDQSNRLNPKVKKAVDVRHKLRQRIRAIDPHVNVWGVDESSIPWGVVKAT